MEKFTITNADNTRMNVDLIRYFKFKNDCYLIYTLNEIDEKGYVKLYLVKIMEELGFPVVYNIKDDKEWSGMQSIVKKVLKEIKNNKRKFLEDLNCNSIQGIKIVEPRFFKLDQKLAEVLSSNYAFGINNDFSELADLKLKTPTIGEVNSEVSTIDGAVEPIQVANDISLNSDQNSNDMESLDATLLKQGAFDPIKSVSPVDIQTSSISTSIIEEGTNNKSISNVGIAAQNSSETLKEQNSNSINSDISSISNTTSEIEINNSISNDVVANESEESNKSTTLIDYKELYMAEKEEKDAINAAMNNLVEQLIKYKEKYGELE